MEFFTDFCREFEEVSICTLGPDFDCDGSVDDPDATVKVVLGEWVKGVSSGGCRNDLVSFSQNPQFILEVPQNPAKNEDGSTKKSQVRKFEISF